jgi:hypothetical protein
VDKKVDLFRHLITLAPLTSSLKIDGFFHGILSDESFIRLFHFDDLSRRQKTSGYIIPLNVERKATLMELLDLEKDQLLLDLTHFCIEDKSELLVTCYDTMEVIQIKTKAFRGLDDLVVNEFTELGIELFDKIDDNGFFNDIQLASA